MKKINYKFIISVVVILGTIMLFSFLFKNQQSGEVTQRSVRNIVSDENPFLVKICKEAPFDVAVTEYKNDADEIGGYFAEYDWKPGTDMMNHPPAYLYDAKGERSGTADFYNSEEKNNEFNSAHDKLKKEFPVTRKVKCI